jgi:hypothetical protein
LLLACLCVGRSGLACAEEAAPAKLEVDAAKKTVSIPCKIAQRKLPNLPEVYPIEVIATYPAPKGQKAHETVVTFDIKPSEIAQAIASLGLKPGKPAKGDAVPTGPELKVSLEIPGPDGKPKATPIEKMIVDRKTGKPMPTLKWYFTGSAMKQPDPEKDEKVYGADLTGTLIAIFPVTDDVVIQTNLTMKEEPLLKLETNKKALPEEGTPAKLIIQAK